MTCLQFLVCWGLSPRCIVENDCGWVHHYWDPPVWARTCTSSCGFTEHCGHCRLPAGPCSKIEWKAQMAWRIQTWTGALEQQQLGVNFCQGTWISILITVGLLLYLPIGSPSYILLHFTARKLFGVLVVRGRTHIPVFLPGEMIDFWWIG